MDERKPMMPGETVRFTCGECNLVFDLCLAPQSEWPEIPKAGMEEEICATCCPIRTEPVAPIHAKIDGRITSYFEWLGAGVYRLDGRSGSMHGKRSPVREVHYGADGERLFLRIDFQEEALSGVEVRLGVQESPVSLNGSLGVFDSGGSFVTGETFAGAQCAFKNILEASIPLTMRVPPLTTVEAE